MNQGFKTYHDRELNRDAYEFGTERTAADTSRLGLQWLDKNKEERFFLFLHYYDPHDIYDPPEPFATRFADDLYAGEIAYTDDAIGQVIVKLKQLGLYDDSLIIIIADRGEMLGEHGKRTHMYFIYQSALRVPLIFKMPGRREHRRVGGLVELIDIMPTICGMRGIEAPGRVQDEDLSSCLEGGPPPARTGISTVKAWFPPHSMPVPC